MGNVALSDVAPPVHISIHGCVYAADRLSRHQYMTEQVRVALALWISILKVFRSNLDRYSHYIARGFSGLPQSVQTGTTLVTTIRLRPLSS